MFATETSIPAPEHGHKNRIDILFENYSCRDKSMRVTKHTRLLCAPESIAHLATARHDGKCYTLVRFVRVPADIDRGIGLLYRTMMIAINRG